MDLGRELPYIVQSIAGKPNVSYIGLNEDTLVDPPLVLCSLGVLLWE